MLSVLFQDAGRVLSFATQQESHQPGAASQSNTANPVKPEAGAPRTVGSTATRPANPSDQKGITVRVQEVNVPVSVLDRHGQPVIDLTEKDFEVYEDGRRQSIRYLYRGTRPPLRIGLIHQRPRAAQ